MGEGVFPLLIFPISILSWPAGVWAIQLKSCDVGAEASAGTFAFDTCADVTWVARTPAGHDSGAVG